MESTGCLLVIMANVEKGLGSLYNSDAIFLLSGSYVGYISGYLKFSSVCLSQTKAYYYVIQTPVILRLAMESTGHHLVTMANVAKGL